MTVRKGAAGEWSPTAFLSNGRAGGQDQDNKVWPREIVVPAAPGVRQVSPPAGDLGLQRGDLFWIWHTSWIRKRRKRSAFTRSCRFCSNRSWWSAAHELRQERRGSPKWSSPSGW